MLRTAPAQATAPVSEVRSGAHIAFLNTAPGAHHGRVALVPLADPGGRRAVSGQSCERVYSAGSRTLCLASSSGIAAVYQAHVLTTEGAEVALSLTGTPSRARLSAEGDLAATTSFVSGDSYAADGFSTRTVITPLSAGDPLRAGKGIDLESFRLVHRGKAIRPADRNYWGVTFAGDHDRFFVTVAFGGDTWLAQGSLTSRTLTTLRAGAECPSLSPDGRRVAYKSSRTASPATGGSRSSSSPAGKRHSWQRTAASTTRSSGSTTLTSCTPCRAPVRRGCSAAMCGGCRPTAAALPRSSSRTRPRPTVQR